MGISIFRLWFTYSIIGRFYFGKMEWNYNFSNWIKHWSKFFIFICKLFFKTICKDKFLNKYKNLEIKFKKSEFLYLLLYRFIGGIPWQLSCVLPTIFNVKIINFFFATLVGIIPQTFLIVSIGAGLEKVIDDNLDAPSIVDIIKTPEIYTPLIIFVCLVILQFF